MEAIGPELFALVQHLYRKKSSAADAIHELTLRSHEKCERADVQMAPTAKEIAYTRWFASMKTRYKVLREQLALKAEAKEADEVISSLYPTGCAAADVGRAFHDAADMVSFRIPEALLSEVSAQRVQSFETRNVSRLNGKELAKEFLQFVVVPALMPSRWWEIQTDAGKRNLTRLISVGLRVDPPSLVIEYRRGDEKSRHRTLYLHEELASTGPITQLSKKLAATHGALLSEPNIQKCLIKLQKLMKDGKLNREIEPIPTAAAPFTSSAASKSTPVTAPEVQKSSNKADLGLLYRDPDAALRDVDLQEADDLTVQEFKAKMNEKFSANVLKPGDPGYAYDKRKQFKAVKKSEWDDDDDDDDDPDEF